VFWSLGYLALRCLLQLVLLRRALTASTSWRSWCCRMSWRCCAAKPVDRSCGRASGSSLASRLLPRSRWGTLLVIPATLLRWHR
jgi:hypothetical protein